MFAKTGRSAPSTSSAPSPAEMPLSLNTAEPAVSEFLTRAHPWSTYRSALRSAPQQLPEGLELPPRRKPALEKALAFAFSQDDPVRHLIVFVRAWVLRLSGPEYAREVGLKANSYSQLEARGFDPDRSVASSYGCFLRDWERRAQNSPESAAFFRWAQRRLERLLLGPDLGTPLGVLLNHQNRVGTRAFADATGLAPETLSAYRELNKNITFSELLTVAEAIAWPPGVKRDRSMWEHPSVVEARRVFYHHSTRLERPASAIKVHLLLTWAKINTTGLALRQEIPTLTEQEAGIVAKFGHVPPQAWQKIKARPDVVGSVPRSFVEAIDDVIEREREHRVALEPSAALAVRLMRAQKLSTKIIARIAGIHDSSAPREGTALVRDCIFEKASSLRLPWGALAALLSRDSENFEQLISLRRGEISRDFRRRGGHDIEPASLLKRVWGIDAPSTDGAVSGAEQLCGKSANAVLKNYLQPYVLGIPSVTMRALVETRGLGKVWRRAHSSPEKLSAIMNSTVIPSYPEFERFLRAGRIQPNELHEIGWRHAYGGFMGGLKSASAFGSIQRRVLNTILFEESESRTEALSKRKHPRLAAAQWFQALDKKGEVPMVIANRLLDLLGVSSGTPRYRSIQSLFRTKDYPSAIREWFAQDMFGLTDAEKRDVTHLMRVGPNISPENLFSVQEAEGSLLDVAHKFKAGSITAMPLSWKRTVRGAHLVMRMFPGATLQDIRGVFAEDGKVVRLLHQPTMISSQWLPRFENYTDRVLREQGILDQATAEKMFIPLGVSRLRQRVISLVGHGVDRSSFFSVLFPETPPALRGDSGEIVEAVRQLINQSAGFINLSAAEKGEVFQAFKEIMSVSRSFDECRTKIGSVLAFDGESTRRETLTVVQALDRLLTFLVFGA